jgi:hypothetical protein
MEAIEQFFLNNPDVMSYHLPGLTPSIYLGLAIMCLFLCFKNTFEDKEKLYSPIPLWATRCWRYSWLFGSVVFAIGAYRLWRNPIEYKLDSFPEIICLLMWLVLFVAGNFGILRAAFRHAREKIREAKIREAASSSRW